MVAFELLGRAVAEAGVAALAVVPALDPVEDRGPRLLPGTEGVAAEQLLLERGVKALADGVVIAIALRAHRLGDPGLAQSATSDERDVLRALIETADPASYMKHHLRGFLDRIGYFEPDALAFVELRDEDGRFAWSAGRFPNGGMVHPRPDLDQCSPIVHSQLALTKPPPCPAD